MNMKVWLNKTLKASVLFIIVVLHVTGSMKSFNNDYNSYLKMNARGTLAGLFKIFTEQDDFILYQQV